MGKYYFGYTFNQGSTKETQHELNLVPRINSLLRDVEGARASPEVHQQRRPDAHQAQLRRPRP